ncbi:MAG TPA: C45 family autoproteolytic acyltransferase/hydrolase, partial [Alphaproteobacteria bacterium]|nr:C45 family autoproteolytic acyltransferase/hydrolase [Alphaproteobacteria bacterium]
MTDILEGLDQDPVTLPPGVGRAESAMQRLRLGNQPLYVLRQRGRFADIAYDHGRLLASEIDRGLLPEISSAIARGIDRESALVERVGAVVYRCYSDRVLKNCGAEFRAAVDALAEGYRAGHAGAHFTKDQTRDALVAIEVGNLVDALGRVLQIPFVRVRFLLNLLLIALPYLFDPQVLAQLARLQRKAGLRDGLARSLRHFAGPRNRWSAACTGFCAGGAYTADGRHIHARNFDGDLFNWRTAPILALIDETPGNRDWHRYVAFGTAGMIYPGGISGLNDAGLAASLHQMSTTRCRSGFLFGQGAIAPYIQQRILREARTLDEAADLARSTHQFAAWTVFCSDAKSGEGLRMEFNADKLRVMRQREPMPQTNHFLHPDMVERQFDATDGHFTPTFGKWLETRARMMLLERSLAAAAPKRDIDTDWAIELLASSDDQELRPLAKDGGQGSWRSFGRIPRKTYGQMTSIVRGDPERRDGHDEVWMTTGERRPGCQSSFTGWRVTWETLDIEPVADRPVRRTTAQTAHGRAHWEQSLGAYIESCLAIDRPRDAKGDLLQRDPTEAEHRAALAASEGHLDRAIALAAQDRLIEVPYHYIRARIRQARG